MIFISNEKEKERVLSEISKTLCENFGLKKVYFAESVGRRLHHIAGYGEESFYPSEKFHLSHNLYVFIESNEELKDDRREKILDFIERELRRLK